MSANYIASLSGGQAAIFSESLRTGQASTACGAAWPQLSDSLKFAACPQLSEMSRSDGVLHIPD